MEKKFKVSIEQSHEFTTEDINNLVVSALEGGINYWCRKAIIKLDENKNYLGISEEDGPMYNSQVMLLVMVALSYCSMLKAVTNGS
jgi:hypothetical protein